MQQQAEYNEMVEKIEQCLGNSREEILKSFQQTPYDFRTFYHVVMNEGKLP